MTLKQQIMADSWDYEFPISNIQANHIVDLADEFAIGFGQWLVSNCYSEDDIYWWLIKTGGDVRKSTKELLEIYKKEKQL